MKTLSDKIGFGTDFDPPNYLKVEDVKEFIKQLKEKLGELEPMNWIANNEIIDKLAGDKLIKENKQ